MSDVSVIIPSFNRGHLIADTLQTVLNQSHAPGEVIVVDDGSTDNTAEVVGRFSSVRYERIPNAGVCRARNVGVGLARFPWLAFCDSDDLWERDRLETQFRLLSHAPNAEYACSNMVTFSSKGQSAQTKFDEAPPGYWGDLPVVYRDRDGFITSVSLYERVLQFQPIFPSTWLLKRSLFERTGGFNETFGRMPAEDVEFTLRCVEEPPLAVVTRPLVRVRKHDTNFSGDQLRNLLTGIEILEHAQQNHRTALGQPALMSERIRQERIKALDAAFSAGNLQLVHRLGQMIGPRRGLRQQLKYLAAAVPAPLGRKLCRLLQDCRSLLPHAGI